MFGVLSRSRKLTDCPFWFVAFATCGEKETTVRPPLSFSMWNKANVRGSYIEEDDMRSFDSVFQSC